MVLKSYWRSFSLSEKISFCWLLLFSISALVAQVLTMLDKEPIAFPEQAFLAPIVSPEHILGTDHLGRDLLFYLLLSCRTAWLLAIPPLIIATLLGVFAGTSAAILSNTGLRISSLKFISLIFLLLLFFYFQEAIRYNLDLWSLENERYIYYAGAFLLAVLVAVIHFPPSLTKSKIVVPVDEVLQKIINVWSTLPKLLLLLVLSAFTPFSLYSLMGWICVTYWVLPARISRACVLQLKEETFYETSDALGIPLKRIFLNYIWPSIKGPILTNFCFASSGLLGIGSTLAFLGIGIPADVPSWGKLLSNARYSNEAWWIFLFPALFLLFSILSLQSLGNKFSTKKTSQSVTK